MDDGLPEDILFVALTRPTMKFGVPYEGYVCNAFGSLIFATVAGSFFYMGVGLILHFVMRAMAQIDPNFFRIYRLWIQTKGMSLTIDVWGGSSLSPLPSAMPGVRELPVSV